MGLPPVPLLCTFMAWRGACRRRQRTMGQGRATAGERVWGRFVSLSAAAVGAMAIRSGRSRACPWAVAMTARKEKISDSCVCGPVEPVTAWEAGLVWFFVRVCLAWLVSRLAGRSWVWSGRIFFGGGVFRSDPFWRGGKALDCGQQQSLAFQVRWADSERANSFLAALPQARPPIASVAAGLPRRRYQACPISARPPTVAPPKTTPPTASTTTARFPTQHSLSAA